MRHVAVNLSSYSAFFWMNAINLLKKLISRKCICVEENMVISTINSYNQEDPDLLKDEVGDFSESSRDKFDLFEELGDQ